MSLMTIGEFGERSRLSPKALRIYEQLGLVVPVEVDASSGYRRYSEDQVEVAQLVGHLRRLGMPLALIGETLDLSPSEAAKAVGDYWSGVEATLEERRSLASYVRARLLKESPKMYTINVRTMPERKLLSINRHLHLDETDAFFHEAFARLRGAADGLPGIIGVPFLIFYGEVSEDSDGPMELSRPVSDDISPAAVAAVPGAQLRTEASHDEAYIHLTVAEMSWPEMLPAYDALGRWARENGRQPAGAVRQLLIADRRSASPDTLTCDLSVPLK
jgi:DNA-binding transcriptional MerR regulator